MAGTTLAALLDLATAPVVELLNYSSTSPVYIVRLYVLCYDGANGRCTYSIAVSTYVLLT